MTPKRFAAVFHYFYTELKAADPTANVTSPSILNWDFTCIGCPGYQSGESWLDDFIFWYNFKYKEIPPVDVWAIDVYPIDWINSPNTGSHALIVIDQLQKMRQYLDSNGYENTPIWITEMAVHLGFDSYQWVHRSTGDVCTKENFFAGDCKPGPAQKWRLEPAGEYRWDKMSDYMINILDWLEMNAASHRIDKWFFFKSFADVANPSNDGYMGISLFDGPDIGANLTCLGEIYRARSLGEPRVKCDKVGNTVPE